MFLSLAAFMRKMWEAVRSEKLSLQARGVVVHEKQVRDESQTEKIDENAKNGKCWREDCRGEAREKFTEVSTKFVREREDQGNPRGWPKENFHHAEAATRPRHQRHDAKRSRKPNKRHPLGVIVAGRAEATVSQLDGVSF